MFKPPSPEERATPPASDEPGGPALFAHAHLVLGCLMVCGGVVGLAYGGRMESLARPGESEGLLAGLFGGLVAGMGGVFPRMGWVLFGLGLPVGLAGWGLGRGFPWARRIVQTLGVAGAILGLLLLTRLALLEALLPLGYAGLVGWMTSPR